MKKLILLILLFVIMPLVCGFTYSEKQNRQDTLHEIAELARSLGLSEDDPIIQRTSELWWDTEMAPVYSYDDLKILSNVVYYEANGCSDRHQQLVAQVVLNRVADDRFPNTIKDVVEQQGQYAAWYTSANPDMEDRCINNARAALDGLVNCPDNVVFQAQFRQGYDIYETFYVNTGWYSSTTYFCYG